MKTTNFFIIIVVFTFLLISACKKADYETKSQFTNEDILKSDE